MALTPIQATCSNCNYSFREKPTRSFLGFQKLTCPSCHEKLTYPLTSGYRATYWVILILLSISIIKALSEGNIAFPGLIAFAMAFALIKDRTLSKKFTS